MAKIKLWTTHKGQREFVKMIKGGVQLGNDGTLNITISKNMAISIGFNKKF